MQVLWLEITGWRQQPEVVFVGELILGLVYMQLVCDLQCTCIQLKETSSDLTSSSVFA